MNKLTRPVWAEINLTNLKYNLGQIKQQLGSDPNILAVVKADAYGHGVVPIASTLVEAGIGRLAVALPEEGVELREAGFILPVQILGEILPSQYPLIMNYNLIPTVSKEETLRGLNQLARKKGTIKKVHLKVDTGMGRIGVFPDSTGVDFVQKAVLLSNIEVEGLMTHFARADEEDKEYTVQQWETFNRFISKLEENGIYIPIKHAANSAAIIDLPAYALNMARPGLMLYGMRPSAQVDADFPLRPVLSWKTRVVFLKEVAAGTSISYGGIYRTEQRAKIATLPMGYADGFFRSLSNQGQVLIHGKRAPIRGRVCMDQFMVDVTDIPRIKTGDEVVLIGTQQGARITATEMADLIGTINYEITCSISKRVPRIYVESG